MRSETANASVRPAAVAGLFYPQDPRELRDAITHYMQSASADEARKKLPSPPKALIVPHAGYVYSGSVAAAAYASIAERCADIRRVVLIGPSHRVFLRGIATSRAAAFETPLGRITIDDELRAELLVDDTVTADDAPHAQEHCLEVQLPFLQQLLGDFMLLPLVAGVAEPAQVADVLERVWGDDATLVLISSDLSHYHSYERAQHIDARTSEQILRRDGALSSEQACGAVCVNGLLHLAQRRQFRVNEILRMNSGDTAGDRRRVVGYGAFAVNQDSHHPVPPRFAGGKECISQL